MGRRLVATAVIFVTLIGITGCGGGNGSGTHATTSPTGSVGAKTAKLIRERLTKAGYSLPTANTDAAASGKKPHGQVASFSIDVDFTSPESFHLYIAVFANRSALTRYIAMLNAERRQGLARCEQIAECRHSLRDSSHEALFGVQRTIGTTYYSATPDKPTGSVPPARRDSILAIASGRP